MISQEKAKQMLLKAARNKVAAVSKDLADEMFDNLETSGTPAQAMNKVAAQQRNMNHEIKEAMCSASHGATGKIRKKKKKKVLGKESRDGSGPHGRGKGPGKGRADGSGLPSQKNQQTNPKLPDSTDDGEDYQFNVRKASDETKPIDPPEPEEKPGVGKLIKRIAEKHIGKSKYSPEQIEEEKNKEHERRKAILKAKAEKKPKMASLIDKVTSSYLEEKDAGFKEDAGAVIGKAKEVGSNILEGGKHVVRKGVGFAKGLGKELKTGFKETIHGIDNDKKKKETTAPPPATTTPIPATKKQVSGGQLEATASALSKKIASNFVLGK